MPWSINGCGTRFYGSREVGPDGSYVTTEWLTFVFLPLIPIRSLRVLPTGKGTNAIVFSSQNYQTARVPFAWTQVRNVYLIVGPILLAILYFTGGDIRMWAKNEWASMQPLRIASAAPEATLDASALAGACGNVLKLEEPAYEKLNILGRLDSVVNESGFTAAEFANITSKKDIEEDAFSAYSLGYLTWDKPLEPTRSDLGNRLIGTINAEVAKLSSDDAATLKVYGRKSLQMLMTAYDMGRRDGRKSPCSP